MGRIRFETRCRADVLETWEVDAPEALYLMTPEDQADWLHAALSEGRAEFVSERAEGEEDRNVLEGIEPAPPREKAAAILAELAEECGYSPEGGCSLDSLITYKDALEDRLTAAYERTTP